MPCHTTNKQQDKGRRINQHLLPTLELIRQLRREQREVIALHRAKRTVRRDLPANATAPILGPWLMLSEILRVSKRPPADA